MIKLIAFDMDGTLTDSGNLITTYANRTLAHYGKGPLPPEKIHCYVGAGAKYLLQGIMNEVGLDLDVDEVYTYYDALYMGDPSGLVTAYEGVKEMLDALGKQGVRRVVLSNRPHNQTLRICETVLDGYLDEVYGQREGIPMKPDPTALHAILKENGVSLEECLYVGDMHYDMDVAINAGVKSVGCVWGLGGYEQVKNADYVLNKPLEILDIIK